MSTFALNRKFSRKSCIAVLTGTVFEYYDYTLYGFFAILITHQFFPNDEPIIGLLKTFGIFVVGSLSKPLGSLIFSQIADREGRSPVLKCSLVGIGLPTTIIGCMPTYAEIGWLAPTVLLLCRIIQGMFVSAESDGARIFLFETLGARYHYTASALSGTACMLGIYLASFAASIVLSNHFPEWAWRVPFVLSGVLGILVLWRRTYLIETPEFTHYRKQNSNAQKSNFYQVISKNKSLIVSTVLICGSAGGCYHFYLIFFGHYLNSVLGILDSTISALYTSRAILIFSASILGIAVAADCFGEKVIISLFKWFIMCLVLMIGINMYCVHQSIFPQWVMLVTTFFMTPLHAIGLVLIYKKLQVDERFRCSSLGHAIGSMLFSGTAPLYSLWLLKVTDWTMMPLFYFLALSLLGYFAVKHLMRSHTSDNAGKLPALQKFNRKAPRQSFV